MSTNSPEEAHEEAEIPSAEQLEEPSTEKDPGEEPKKDASADPESSHEAVGIGVVGGKLNDSMPD